MMLDACRCFRYGESLFFVIFIKRTLFMFFSATSIVTEDIQSRSPKSTELLQERF
jgi:hypothetical protein